MILVFGQTGQVARELARIAPAGTTFVPREAADLSDPAACAAAIQAARPGAVINAAAYTAVDRAESEEALATTINGDAPGAMAAACAALNIPFLHISTDYVFDGSQGPWPPEAPTAPINAYGRSKLAGEIATRAAGGQHAILRTAWVFSAHGNNFVKTMLRLAETRDALSVVGDQIGGPTPASGIAAALLRMTKAMQADPAKGGTYHYAGAPAASWAGFARETFALAGKDVTVTDIPSTDYPTPAARPADSRLDCTTLETDFAIPPADWQAALRDVITELSNQEHSQ